MQTFLRSRRWVAGPSLLAWLSTIMRGQSPSLLAHYNGFFAFTAALLGGLAFGPSEAWAQTTNCTATRTGVNFATRTSGEDWKNRAAERVPTAASFSQLSTAYAASPTNANVTLTTGTLNASQTLVWSTAYSNNAGSSTVTFNFGRTVSNVSIQVDDIDAVFTPAGALGGFLTPSSGYTDEVTFTGTNSGSAVVPTLAKVNTASTYVTTASTATSAVATGQTTAGENTSATDASVIATYANVSSITIQLRNPTAGSTVNGQSVGISTINWCRIVPTTADVTTATVPSTATQVGISGLSGQADGTLTYVVSPLPAQGTLLYNNGGMYTAVAAGQNLTAAQAASLRYTPDASFTGTSTTFTYVLKDDASQTSNTSTYTIPLSPFTACATATNKLTFLTQPAGDDWKKHAALAVPAGSTVTTLSSDGYTSGATTANGSSLVTGNINGVQSLAWTNQYTSTTAGTGTTPGTGRSSSVTFTFNRSVSNLSLQVQDIDFQAGSFTDQVVFSGANGGAPIAPTLTVLNPNSGTVTVSGNTATGRNYNTDNTTDGTVIVYFPSPILTLTITYNNATTSSSISSTQGIGIDYISWCRVAPTANSVTTAAVPNNAAQAGINSLSGMADGTINSYLITSLPANGTLLYNNNGTYAAVAANQTLTAAQAASLRYTPDAGFTGTSTTFDYKAIDDANLTSANTATYTIPLQYSTPCAINQSTFDFSTRTVNEDWKARTGVPVAPGATTTISSSNYTSAAAAAATGLAIATLNSNTLYWNNDYSGAPRTSSVTFTFSRPVANFSVRIQDIDAANNFIDVVTFAGSNGSTNVTPTLVAANPGAGIVTINGATATGIANTFSTVDGTVTAYFPSPIITLTLTYANGTTAADPDNQAIGIDLMSFCRQAPVASNVTNPSRPAGQGATPINSLNASSADGSITSYTVTAVPAATQGTFFYNNGGTATALTANQTLTPAQATQLTFAPAAGFSGTTSFSYFATDDAGNVSNTATNSVPVTNTGAAGTVAGCAAPGKDGSPTLSTNPNTYYPATASAAAGTTSIAVGAGTLGSTAASATTISKGDLLLVIQMQGADIDYTNTDSYGDGVAGGGASGNLTTNFQAGTYEYVVASNATPITLSTGGTITLASALTNSYVSTAASTTAGPRSFQVVRIPQYANLTLNGTLTALPWNGSVGGIIALDVAGRTSFGGNTIDASGRGFRGGGGRTQGTAAGNNLDYVGTTAANAHAQKGEGTAGTPRYVNVPTTTNDAGTNATVDSGSDGYAGGTFSRGAPGNAGGGGNNNIDNSGGGGGANGGNGGRGGNKFAGANEPVGGEPGTYFGPVSSARLVLGGGGGAGTTNNNTGTPDNGYASSGAAGGGLVLLRTGTITGTGTILANGGNANSSVGDDGSGGGGAGGSILVTATNTAGLAGLTLTANGGNGGSNLGSANGNGPHGPGGGGGGGVVLANGTVASASASAGANGTTRNSGTTAFGATAGQPGITNAQISSAIAGSAAGTTCVADVATTISGPAAASAGQPTGNYTATFSANGASGAANVTQTVTLPAGAGLTAAQLATIVAAYPGTTITKTGAGASTSTVINFGTTTLLSGTTNSFVFAYTAPTAAGTYNTTSTTTTASNEGGQTANNTSSAATTVGTAADVTVSLSGPTTLNAGQPTGNYTATFTNEGPGTATNVARHVTLPAGASLTLSQQATIQATYTDTTFPTASTIDFGALPSLASDASNTVQFAFTAPATVLNNLTLTANTSTLASEGTNLAPNQTTLALTTVTTADVVARVSGATSLVGNVPTGTFTVNFTNNGPQPAGNVTRTVQLPTGLTGVVVSGADAGSYSPTTGLVTYTTTPTTLASGATLSSTITFPIPATRGQVVATASVSTSTNEAGLTTNNAAAATMPAAYDLATTISGPTTAVAGSPVTLYVTTTNYGPNAAPTALQTVSIPSSAPLTNVYITNGGTYSYNNTTKTGTVTFPDLTNPGSGVTTTNLPGGQTIANSISFTAPAENFAPTATVALNSTSTGTGEMTTDNNTANLNGGVTGSPVAVNTNTAALATANESTTITTTSTVVSAGTSVTYKVAATNQGPGVATNVIQQVLLLPGFSPATLTVGGLTGTPSGNTITYASGGTTVATYSTLTGLLTYATLATQASGATQSFGDIVLTVPASTGNNGQLLASANVRTSTNDPVPADNVAAVAVKVTATADLATTVTGPSSITAGQTASYTVAFTNNGTGTAGTVAETMQLPAGLSNMVVQDPSGNVLAGAYSSTTGLVTFPTIASDAAGATQVYIVAFTAPGQPYSVSSSMGSGTPDNVGTNNSSVLRTTVSPAADVAVTVSGPATATTGNSVTYAATTFNNGPNQASTVVPTIQLPMGLSGVTVIGGTYDAGTGTVTFNAYSLAAGESRVSLVTFTMPANPANGFVTGTASVSTASTDLVASNNTAGVTTAVAPATPDMADLVTSILASNTTLVAGSPLSYTIKFANNTASTPALNVVPTAYLPAGLTGVVVKDINDVIVLNAYNSTTGQVTFPTIASLSAGNPPTYTISLTAPANAAGVAITASAVSANTSDPNPTNNSVGNTVNITASFDEVTRLAGPTTALPGTTNTYSVTTTNNGPSNAPGTANTVQTVTLPAGVVATNITGGGMQSGNVITFPASSTVQAAGANGAVTNTFSIVMPPSGSLALSAAVTSTGESNTTNNGTTLTTAPTNQVPVAENMWNTLQNARGNTSNSVATTGLPISPLFATDPDGSVASYTIATLPDASQGVLYYNGAAATAGQSVAASGLSFAPASTFVGNATFTYTALDNANGVSNLALYTIPVAKDLAAIYTAYNSTKGGVNKYVTGDVLAQVTDTNGASYNDAGLIYDATTGVLQGGGAGNGLPTTGTNATITSGTLPSGVSLDPATGRIYVSNASQLVNNAGPQTYTVTITTVDKNGGVTTQPVSFTIGAYPLPVTLVAFTAQAVANRDAQLNWSTASELHNDHFDIERSFDGTHFTKIGVVAGQGTTSLASAYAFTDAGVATQAAGPVYYRLRQVDLDGTATFSPVRFVRFVRETSTAPVALGLYPNPAQASTQLDLSQLPATGTYQVLLLDATGRTVRTAMLAGGLPQPLEVQDLARGTYLVRITGQLLNGAAFQQTLRLTKE